MSQARQYELVYIMAPEATEQEVADLHTQIEAIITRYQGELVKTENWGRRKLAFRIGKHREGTYVLEVFTGTRRAHQGAGSPPEGHRQRHQAPLRPRGRGAAPRRAHARAPRRGDAEAHREGAARRRAVTAVG